jgi:hypothetical protein
LNGRKKYLIAVLFAFGCINAQTREFNFTKGTCQSFNGNLYSFGLLSEKQNAVLCIYKLDFKLNTVDSLVTELGKNNRDNYLQIYSDTLHDYLNIYIQKKEKKAVTVLRLNKKFERIANADNIEITRLNNTAMFGSDVFYFKNSVYDIKVVSDTSGKQFYLNKYDLKSENANFDYDLKWQFPFERKSIRSAHVFFANKNYVLVYVGVSGGPKTGQWVLKINARDGKIVRGTKLNDKGETNSYQFGTFFIDNAYRSVHLLGQKFTEAQFEQKENKLAISNLPFATVFHVEIDSTGDVTNRQDFKIPVVESKTGAKKAASSYILRSNNFRKTNDGGMSFETDVYKASGNSLCFLYSNTTQFRIIPVEEKMVLEKNAIASNSLIEQYYVTPDKLDMNGKLCIDSLTQFEKMFYKPLTLGVKEQFKINEEKNPVWVLTKSSTKKNVINYTLLSPVKKIYQLTSIEDIPKSFNPVLINLNANSFLISTQAEEGKHLLKLFTW